MRNRDKPGEAGEVLENPRISTGMGIIRAGKARTFSFSLSAKASTAVGVFLCAQRPLEAARRRRRGAAGTGPAEQENPRKTA